MNLHFLSFDSACEASQVHGIVTGEDEIGCHVQSITNKTLRRRLTTEDSGIPQKTSVDHWSGKIQWFVEGAVLTIQKKYLKMT